MSQGRATSTDLPSGNGRIVVSSHASKAVFSELASTYPLKLLSPSIGPSGIAVVYVMSYGGGLIGGDEVYLTVCIQDEAQLVMLSQGSTKVFKMRIGSRLATPVKRQDLLSSSVGTNTLTTQVFEYHVGEGCGLYLLPEPVTCFRDASYKQIQRFNLSSTGSLVLLDSITSGRQALGEDWDFAKYYSLNEVKVDGKLVAKDVLLLEDPNSSPTPMTQSGSTRIPYRPLREQLAPYSCYAMVLLYGPQVQEAIEDISAQYKHITVYQMKQTPDSLWSFSLLGATSSEGAIVRVAGKESEIVRSCLKSILRRLDVTIGIDTYRRAFA